MSIISAILGEFSHEAETTRRLLERVPEEKLSWKPHPKSMSLGQLAGHIATIPGWSQAIFGGEEFDLASTNSKAQSGPSEPGSLQELLSAFEENRKTFTEALDGRGDEELRVNWRLRRGEKVLLDFPRIVALRSFILSHLIHHRGQLSVYLRLLDVPLPQIYGPSADDQTGFAD